MLPAVFVVGQSVAAERMARHDIFCLGFDRITMAGMFALVPSWE